MTKTEPEERFSIDFKRKPMSDYRNEAENFLEDIPLDKLEAILKKRPVA